MKAQANGIELEYEDFGPTDAPVVLLIMGLGAQLTRWPVGFIDVLLARGYRVIRYDNRDVGLSSKIEAAGVPDLAAMMRGEAIEVAYTIDDMADDAVALLDALGISRAHVIGASMGGMIAQMVAANHPARTLSLTSIMSSSGNPALPGATAEAMAVLTARAPADDIEALVEQSVRSDRVIGSPGYPSDPDVVRANARRDIERMVYPAGYVRQMAAISASGDRRAAIATITAPTIVIHGIDDPLVRVDAGRDTAANIPHSTLIEVPGMGHNLPEPLFDMIANAFESVAHMPVTQH